MNVAGNDVMWLRVFSLIRPVPADATAEEIAFHTDKLKHLLAKPFDADFADGMRISLADCEKRLIEA